MTNLTLLPEDIRSEFTIDEQGRAFASRRAIARLAGVDESTVRGLLAALGAGKPPSKILENFTGQGFEGAGKLPDILVSAVIQHYAFKGKEQAQFVATTFAAVGFRAWVQSELGWQKPQTPVSAFELLAQMAMESAKLEKRLNQAEQTINQLLTTQQQAEAELKALPISEAPAPEKPTRAKINEIVRNYVQRNNISHQSAWNKLYKELYYRCHIDVDARCKNRKSAKIDIVEEAGYMEQLHAIASEVLC